ncbi:MAG: DUF1538 domain-containing protein [Mariprofundaceae bacterium]|nr:DUF1538 domain-containing protein [Mariprofundaceae bacterium]
MSSGNRKIRFGALVRETSVKQNVVSFNDIVPEATPDQQGNLVVPRPANIRLRLLDIYRLLQPYISVRFIEQMRAVLPLAVYLLLFQILILHQKVSIPESIIIGLFAVMIGLMLFMEGLKRGLMPFGEIIGKTLPAKAPLKLVLLIALLLGIGVTFAEPAIGALKAAGSIVVVEKAPYLYTILNDWSTALVLAVGSGVGLAAVLGTLRLLYGWSLKPLIYITLIPLIGLTLYLASDPGLSIMLGLAWDCGAVTTGPVTVPLVLALGIGIATTAGKGKSPLAGFGIVTLASLFPVIAVILLGIFIGSITTPGQIIAAAQGAQHLTALSGETSWLETSPWQEAISGIRAIVPLVAFLVIVLHYILKERLRNRGTIIYGIVLCVLGMIIFNLGLEYGLSRLGEQSGSLLPASFTTMADIAASPYYSWGLGIMIVLVFAWFLGFGATLAEPALNALGITVQTLTNGAFEKSLLLYAVSVGVGCGIALGVAKIIFSLPLTWLVVPGYGLALILTWLSSEEFVNVAWDSAGVTTGPITVPLVLAMGLGLGNAVEAVEGFGILALASIGPIISVLGTGLWVQWKIRRHHRQRDRPVTKTVEEAT